jgi:glycosyltransferase involved in cell wall biosynthesis
MISTSPGHTQALRQRDKVLAIAGIPIAIRPLDAHRPRLDYQALQEACALDFLDPTKVSAATGGMAPLTRRLFGTYKAVLIESLRKSQSYRALLALGEDVGFPLAAAKKYLGLRFPLVVICHNVTSPSRVFFMERLKAASAVDKFLLLSESHRRVMVERYGVPPGKIEMMYNPVDHHFFTPQPQIAVKNQICSAGVTCRDYATFVAATEGLDVDVKIDANSLWHDDPLNISPDNLPPRVEVLLGRTTAQLRELYAESKVVVVPIRDIDHAVGYTVIAEAMAMGKPVIATKIKQYFDLLEDGHNGFFVQPGDVAGLREKLSYLLAHPEEAQRMGDNGRRLIEERSNLDLYIGRIVSAVAETAS